MRSASITDRVSWNPENREPENRELNMTRANTELEGVDESPPTREEAERIHDGCVQMLKLAAADELVGKRLALAQTTLQVHFVDAEPLVITVLLDREPVEVTDRALGEAEVHIFIKTRDVDRFWTGDLELAIAIISGEVTYQGPVRKVLRIVPILRRFVDTYRRLQAGGEPATSPGAPDNPTGTVPAAGQRDIVPGPRDAREDDDA